jgi:P4 family phage/plasmid primase-like protien
LKHGKVAWGRETVKELGAGFLHMLRMDCPFGDHANTSDTEAWAAVNECGQKRFKCSHNTCRDRSWNEFRTLLEGRHGKYRFAPPPEDPNEYEFSAKRKPDESMPEFIRRNLLWNGTIDSFSPFVVTDALGNFEEFESRAAAVAAHRESLLKEYEGDVEIVELLLKRVRWKTSSSVLGIEVPGRIEMTERGNALRLLKARGRVIRYVPGKGWMGRGRSFWFRDVADSNIREQMDHVLQHADFKGDAKSVARWRRRCQTAANLSSSIKRADALADFRTVLSAFDSDTLMCNLRSSVLRFDKNTGALSVSKHSLDDMTTFAMPVDYDPQATCEKFEAFLAWMIPDKEQRVYLQTYIGLCLTGLKTRAFLTFVGVGRNGKSVLNKILAGLFGPVIEDGRGSNPYYLTCNMSTLTSADEQAGAARADLVRLDAARVIAVSESNKSNAKTPVKFNMAFLKNWTGDDPASPARGLYEAKMDDCRAYGKFFIFTNCLPEVSENTAAAWERIKVIECNSVVDPAKEDPQLHEKLLAERPGILNWAMRGLAMYFAKGQTIPTPASMQKSVEEYRADDDPIRHFLKEQCREAGARDAEGKLIQTSVKILHSRFERWYQDEIGECFMKIKAFKKGVEEARAIKSTRRHDGNYLPVALNDPPKDENDLPEFSEMRGETASDTL